MLWIHYLVGTNHFAECCENQPVTVLESVHKSAKIPYSATMREVEI